MTLSGPGAAEAVVEGFGVRRLTPSGASVLLRNEPLEIKGAVVRGFGRGGKMLGCPTANIPTDPYTETLESLPGGVYFGWASLARSNVSSGTERYKMVASIGWNPYFQNTKKTIEPHLLHQFDGDFYDVELRLVITGFIRLEANFTSLEALKEAIASDIRTTDEILNEKDLRDGGKHPFLEQNARATE